MEGNGDSMDQEKPCIEDIRFLIKIIELIYGKNFPSWANYRCYKGDPPGGKICLLAHKVKKPGSCRFQRDGYEDAKNAAKELLKEYEKDEHLTEIILEAYIREPLKIPTFFLPSA